MRPDGTLGTVPLPLPSNFTLKVFNELDGFAEKVAETEREDVRVTEQFPVPEQAPSHPAKL